MDVNAVPSIRDVADAVVDEFLVGGDCLPATVVEGGRSPCGVVTGGKEPVGAEGNALAELGGVEVAGIGIAVIREAGIGRGGLGRCEGSAGGEQ
jgi:hypothetical protein